MAHGADLKNNLPFALLAKIINNICGTFGPHFTQYVKPGNHGVFLIVEVNFGWHFFPFPRHTRYVVAPLFESALGRERLSTKQRMFCCAVSMEGKGRGGFFFLSLHADHVREPIQ